MLQRAVRLPSRTLVQVQTPKGRFDATIGNLSPGGARLLGVPDGMLNVGDMLTIICLNQPHRAQVRWHFDDTCGLQFSQPLTEREIDAMRTSRWAY